MKQLCFASNRSVLLLPNASSQLSPGYSMAKQHTECARAAYSFAELLLGIQSMHPEEVCRHLGRA